MRYLDWNPLARSSNLSLPVQTKFNKNYYAFDIFVRELKSRYGSRGRLNFTRFATILFFRRGKMRLRRILRPLTRPRAEKIKSKRVKLSRPRELGSF